MTTTSWWSSAQSMPANHICRTLLAAIDRLLDQRVLLLRRSKRDSLIITFPGTTKDEARSFIIGRAVWRHWPFVFCAQQVTRGRSPLRWPFRREGLHLVYCKRRQADRLRSAPRLRRFYASFPGDCLYRQ